MKSIRTLITLSLVASLSTTVTRGGNPDGPRTVDNPKGGGGISVSPSAAASMAQGFGDGKSVNARQAFFLSKAAIDSIFANDLSATGIMLVPVRDEGNNMNIAAKGYRSDRIVVDSKAGNSVYLMQTFCPTDCDMMNELGKE